MRKLLVQEISNIFEIPNQILIEKDIIIHEILMDLSREKFIVKNLLFKGGTCLVKAFLNYVRFSEDMDFTWRDQGIFQGKTNKQQRRHLSNLIEETAKILAVITQKRGFDFKYEKGNPDYVKLGGSNKLCTFFIWYMSEITNERIFLKLQINFVEKLLYPHNSKELESLVTGDRGALGTVFKDSEYLSKIKFPTYSLEEMLCEKIRAILTRKGIKDRDFFDVFFICETFEIKLADVEKECIEKLDFSLKHYKKYRDAVNEKINEFEKEDFFELKDTETPLLQKIDQEKFYSFTIELRKFLSTIIPKISYKDET